MSKKVLAVLAALMVLIVALAAIYAVVWGIAKALERQDRAECERFNVELRERPGFYLTEGEQEMCAYLKVDIITPKPTMAALNEL